MKSSALLRMCATKLVNHSAFVKNVGSANSAQTSGTTVVITVPSAGVPVGHTLITRSVSDYISSGPTITDSRGNTYTSARTASGTGSIGRSSIHYSQITTALVSGDVITFTWGSALTNRAASIDEFSGLLTPIAIDAQNGSTGSSTTPDANVTTTYLSDLVIAVVAPMAPTTDGYTQDSAWQSLGSAGTSGGTAPYVSVHGGYMKVTSVNTWHYKPVLANSGVWIALCVAFKST